MKQHLEELSLYGYNAYSGRLSSITHLQPTAMTAPSDDHDTPSLNDVVLHISHALDALDRLIASQESRTTTDQRILRRMIRRLFRPNRLTPEQRVKKIAGLMRRFTFLCRLDDHRNELQSLRDDFVTLESGRRVPASEIPYWRREFYADMAAVLVLDQQCFADSSVSK